MKLRVLAIVLLAMLLAGCGFRPAGTLDVANLEDMYVLDATALGSSGMAWQVQQEMKLRGVPAAARSDDRRVLRILGEDWDRRPLSLTADARTAEYELIGSVEFELLGSDGRVLIPARTITADAVLRRDSQRLLGSSQEESRLREELRQELARRVLSASSAVGRRR